MNFYAIAAFLDPSRGQTLFPFSKTFQPVYESEKMPAPRFGRPPIHDTPPKWNLEEVKMARRAGVDESTTQAPPTSAVGRMFGALTGIKRSRPNTPASTEKALKPLTSSRPGIATPVNDQVDSNGSTPVPSGGLLGGLRQKLAKRPGTSPGIVSIAPPSHSAPLARGPREDLQLTRFDTHASGKSVSGKSIKGMMSKLRPKSSSRPGSAQDGHFPRYDQVPSLGPVQPAGPLGRRRSKSAASALFPARISPSPLGLVCEESVSGQIDESKVQSDKSTKTIMGRLRTLSVGSRPSSRAKSPLAVESVATLEPVEVVDDRTEATKSKGVMGRIRSLSSASRPGSSRGAPVEHPNFDLEELLSAREAAGSALGTHDPATSLIQHVRAASGSVRPGLPRSTSSSTQICPTPSRPNLPRSSSGTIPASPHVRPNMPRTQSNLSQVCPTPPFVLEELLQARTFDSSDSLASLAASPTLGPAKWKGKGKEIVSDVRPRSSRRPGSSRELPVWFTEIGPKSNMGSSRSINSLANGEGSSSSSSSRQRPSPPQLESIVNQVTIISGDRSSRESVTLMKRSSLSIQDIAEYVDGKFSNSTISDISLSDRSSSGSGSDDQVNSKPDQSMNFADAIEMSNRRRGLSPSTSVPRQLTANDEQVETLASPPAPLARKNTFDRLLTAGESLTMQAINNSVQRIVEENQLAPIDEASGSADDSDGSAYGSKSRKSKLQRRDRPFTPPVLIEGSPMECVVLPRPGGIIPKITSLAAIDPNIVNLTPSTPSKSSASNVARARPPTADAYGTSRNKENVPVTPATPAPITPTPSLWQRLTKPKSLSNLKAAATSPLPSTANTPPLPPLPRSAQTSGSSSPQAPRDMGSDPFQSARSAGKRPATSSDEPANPSLPRATVSSTSVSSMANSAPHTGIVLMQNTAPAHSRNCHPWAVAIRPIENRIPASEWTSSNPQPTHYLVEDQAFKRAMEERREEQREEIKNSTFPNIWAEVSMSTSTSSSALGQPPLKPILRKRPSTTQTEQIPHENLDRNAPTHLRPYQWDPDSRESSPIPSPLSSRSGPVPPRRGRPSTAQVQR